MRDFLTALKGFGIIGFALDVETAEEKTELGETAAAAFDICLLNG